MTMDPEQARAILERELTGLDAAAIPTKSEVYVISGGSARAVHDAIKTLLVTAPISAQDTELKAVSLRPPSTEDWSKLSKREQQLSAIADSIGYWIQYATKDFEEGNLTIKADAHVILPGDNAPPHWPTVGQLGRWLAVLRDHSPENLTAEQLA